MRFILILLSIYLLWDSFYITEIKHYIGISILCLIYFVYEAVIYQKIEISNRCQELEEQIAELENHNNEYDWIDY